MTTALIAILFVLILLAVASLWGSPDDHDDTDMWL